MYEDQTIHGISRLLHDARLRSVRWEPAIGVCVVVFDCLRRNPDGSSPVDPSVEFRVSSVQVLAVAYDSAVPRTRPSDFDPRGAIGMDTLADWPFRPQHATLEINSSAAQEEFLEAARIDWLTGDEDTCDEAGLRFCIGIDHWAEFGVPAIAVCLLVAGGDFTLTSGGIPLSPDEWAKQFDAWWRAWEGHWQAAERHVQVEPGEFDVAIPARDDAYPDLGYRPPAEPVFALEPTNAPPALLRPIRDWFEGHHEQDWARMARVHRRPGRTIAEQAEWIKESKLGWDFGRWDYPRVIDTWWVEGRRACVVVRGIQHVMDGESATATNREVVWSFDLRYRGEDWMLRRYCEEYPRPSRVGWLLGGRGHWLGRWKSGEIR